MNRTVVITGASSGIGKQTAVRFARAGWNVAATSRKPDAGQFKGLKNVKTYRLDVNDADSIKEAFKRVSNDFGSIEAVVNNAGYALQGVFEAFSDEQVRGQFETNFFGMMAVTKEAVRYMRPNKDGTIIQIASMGGRLAFPTYSLYHATKWAVEGFSESLSYELRELGIKVKIIEPGVIKTHFYNSSRTYVEPDARSGYGNFMDKTKKATRYADRVGEDPGKVANTILKAANDRSDRLRFIVGKPAPLLFFLRKVLPERLFRFIIRKGYGL